MKYAVVQIGGRQYKVSEGQEILVDRLNEGEGGKLNIEKVLLLRADELVLIGTPYLEKNRVICKILDEVKGEKIRVSKFKAKVRYRRTIGFRHMHSRILVEKITVGNDQKTDKKESCQREEGKKRPVKKLLDNREKKK